MKRKRAQKEKVIERKELVRKSNVFIDGRYRFGLHEQKILLLVVSKIKMNQSDFVPYRVTWGEIKQVSKGYLDTVAKIDKACESLKNKTISIKSGSVTDNFGFLSGWKTHQGQFVEFRVDPSMKDMLLGLLEEGHFTLYDLEFALALPSAHSVRIYEILKSHSWKKQPVEISLDDLKTSLDIALDNTTYKDFGNFRQNVLEPSKKNLKEHTDISFTFTTIKVMRRVVALSFTIRENKKFQRTVQAAAGRDFVRPGDTVLIGGKECCVDGSGLQYGASFFGIGQLTTLLKEGKIKLLS